MAKKTRFYCPTNCLVCHSKYEGDSVRPYEPMKEGLRVFFECGSMRVKSVDDEQFMVLISCHRKGVKNGKDGIRAKQEIGNGLQE